MIVFMSAFAPILPVPFMEVSCSITPFSCMWLKKEQTSWNIAIKSFVYGMENLLVQRPL